MRAIFVSYRRDDSEGEAGRLFDDLVGQFGEDSVFMDVTAIEAGRDFRKVIDESVATCGVLLAIIGKSWLDAKDDAGKRRLDDPADFVRLETASALRRDIPVIPVIVRGARMPRAEELPDDLKDLAYRNAVELTHARWATDLQVLIKALRSHLERSKSLAGDPQSPPVRVGDKISPAAVEDREQPIAKPAPVPATPNSWFVRSLIMFAVLFVACVIAVVIYMTWQKSVTVPDLVGSNLAEATAKLQASGLTLGEKTLKPDETKAPNVVLEQSPAAGTQGRAGSAVSVTLSQRAAHVKVPALRGLTLEAAQLKLGQLQLETGAVQRQAVQGFAPDTVLREIPAAGEAVVPGSRVDLVVASPLQPPHPKNPCAPGYVWRLASPSDHVCVTPATRSQTAYDNSQASVRCAGKGSYGPNTCKPGFVWREAFPNDDVCVNPATRAQAAADNKAAQSRTAGN